jgi:hypothetical protein
MIDNNRNCNYDNTPGQVMEAAFARLLALTDPARHSSTRRYKTIAHLSLSLSCSSDASWGAGYDKSGVRLFRRDGRPEREVSCEDASMPMFKGVGVVRAAPFKVCVGVWVDRWMVVCPYVLWGSLISFSNQSLIDR